MSNDVRARVLKVKSASHKTLLALRDQPWTGDPEVGTRNFMAFNAIGVSAVTDCCGKSVFYAADDVYVLTAGLGSDIGRAALSTGTAHRPSTQTGEAWEFFFEPTTSECIVWRLVSRTLPGANAVMTTPTMYGMSPAHIEAYGPPEPGMWPKPLGEELTTALRKARDGLGTGGVRYTMQQFLGDPESPLAPTESPAKRPRTD
jgi:hypothetical protein